MPELDFSVIDVRPAAHGLVPLFEFKLRIGARPATERVAAVLLHAQVQLQPAARPYTPRERERLVELFGPPAEWGRSLRNRLWAQVDATVPPFVGETDVRLAVPCTFDLNVAAAKYFYALEDGEVSVVFLFSGTIFSSEATGRLQAQRIGWDKECVFALPVRAWRELMEQHYPNTAWIYLRRDSFERLAAHRRRHAFATWEQTIEHLLAATPEPAEVGA